MGFTPILHYQAILFYLCDVLLNCKEIEKGSYMIYLVEDDSGIRDLMIYALKASGYEAQGFEKSEGFWQAMEHKLPELVILDIMLPGENGLTILQKLRQNSGTYRLPVIMATAKGSEYDRVVGLDMGADDYLSKPFGMMEMVSRVKALLRRTGQAEPQKLLTLGDLEMNPAEHTVKISGEFIELTLKEYNLLKIFLENKGLVFSREKLLSEVWGAQFIGESRTVDVHVGTLRSKLGKWGDSIRTVRGVGYRMEDRL